jgi:YVTN family beta-propeller protein
VLQGAHGPFFFLGVFIFHLPNSLKMKVLRIFLFISFCWSLAACVDNDDNNPPGGEEKNYTSGILVVNEGPFGGTGTITWHDPSTGTTVQDIFGKANNGAKLGQFVNSLALHKGLMYICVTDANKVYVVEPATFEYIDTLEGLVKPRFFLPIDDRFALVSQWGADGYGNKIVKVDLNTRRIVQEITCGTGPDFMVEQDGSIYVANSGGFGTDSTLTVLNKSTLAVTSTINLGAKNPGKIVATGTKIFALCKGSFLDATPAGAIWSANNSVALAPYASDMVNATGSDKSYYSVSNSLWSYAGDGTQPTKLFDTPGYGLTLNSNGTSIFSTDPKDFTKDGEVLELNLTTGAVIKSFPAGIAPSKIYVAQ